MLLIPSIQYLYRYFYHGLAVGGSGGGRDDGRVRRRASSRLLPGPILGRQACGGPDAPWPVPGGETRLRRTRFRYYYPGMVRPPLSGVERERGERLGVLLRRARGDRSMAQIASVAGVSTETLRKIETGRVPTPAFFTVVALAAALDLPLDAVASVSLGGEPEGPALSA
ncbi:putative transcriptional regulator [Actinoalloteichus sp. GBA129-24]|uniref:Transcriptional regulator n=2 Tax=Pseudonocardiaceae TaxID=2070 RepID=A0AAC9LBA0_9PSEU|nr:putative transcriptional regulator [Actinoalloteichus fjordicus]APU20396.1 putative transcriptional regulator [Actinoalloteichus sp. GBA129-24]